MIAALFSIESLFYAITLQFGESAEMKIGASEILKAYNKPAV